MAPMAGFTDLAFRKICAEYGSLYSVTEMVSCKAIEFGNRKTETLYTYEKMPCPQGIQLFGSEPETVKRVIDELVNQLDYDVIDFNMACPVPKIFNNNEGSALMKNPELAGKIVRAAVSVSKKPFSVKIRLGVSEDRINAADFAKVLEDAGCAFITVHGRTRDMYYSGTAMLEEIAKVKRAISIPLIANGDITSPEEAERMFAETGCDAVMIGRGALGKPFLFRQIRDYFETGSYDVSRTAAELVELMKRQYLMMLDYKSDKLALMEMRKHSHRYLRGIPGATRYKDKINHCRNREEYFSCLEEIKKGGS